VKRLSILFAIVASLVLASTALAANPKYRTFGDGAVTQDPAGTFTLVNGAGEYSGVYLNSRSQSGKYLARVDFSFSAIGDIAGGAPRFSIPVDTNGDNVVEFYAFGDRANCGGSESVTTVGTTCTWYAGGQSGSWDDLAAANPMWRVAPGSIPFIIADQPGTYTVFDIVLR
jgi:hypothetical protein